MVVVVRVMVAEDNMLVRTGLQAMLATMPELEVLSAQASFDDLMGAVAADPPDVVLADIRMPPTYTDEGVRAALLLRRSHPDVGVVVLSHYLDPLQALALVDAGSRRRGYLLKDRVANRGQLLDAILAVARGGSYMDPLVVDALVEARHGGSSQMARLTPRETDVLAAVAKGMSNQAIAASLHVTDRAVEKHINSIFSKLGLTTAPDVHKRVASVLFYLTHGNHDSGGRTSDGGTAL